MSRIATSSTTYVRTDNLTRRNSSNSLRDRRKTMSTLGESTENLSTLSEKADITRLPKSPGKRASFSGKGNKPYSEAVSLFPMFDDLQRMKGDLEVKMDIKSTDKGGKESPLPRLPKISSPPGSLERYIYIYICIHV
jgi:hypothetical protein